MSDENFMEVKQTFEKYNLDNIFNQLDINKIRSEEMVVSEVLAAGGQGKVLLCDYYGMKVILKTLHRLNTKDYTNEVVNVYKYRHPNIPKFIGIYDCPKNYGLVFEFVEGITLSKQIQLERNGVLKLSFIQKLDYMIQLCSVIQLLHDHELIHRDLKTANVMIDSLGNLKLLDFGIAIEEKKGINLSLESTDFALTPTYIPPEILLQNQEDSDDDNSDNENSTGKNNMNKTILSNQTTNVLSNSNNTTNNNTGNINKVMTQTEFQKVIRNIQNSKIYAMKKTGASAFKNTVKGMHKVVNSRHNTLTGNLNTSLRSSNKPVSSQRSNFHLNTMKLNTSSGINQTNNGAKNMKNYMKSLYGEIDEIKETTVNITNKFDIWTVGLILSEYFTLIRPWGRTDKESRTDVEIRALIFRKVPFYTPKHDKISDPEAYNLIMEIIKKCTNYDPEKRPTIAEVRLELSYLFNKEVIKQKQIEDAKALTITRDELKGAELLKYKKALLRSHQEVFFKSKVRELVGKDVLLFPNLKVNKQESDNLIYGEIVNTIQKCNLFKQQQISVLKQKIFLAQQTILTNSNSDSYTKYNRALYTELNATYYYSTYNEFEDSLIITQFPEEVLKVIPKVTKKVFGNLSKLKYRNPFCLNTNYGFLLLGGLVMEENESNPKLKDLAENSCYSSTYKRMYGDNYFPTNRCFLFDYEKMKLKVFPFMNAKRHFFGAVYVNGVIWIIGGGNKRCEVLLFEDYLKNKENDKYRLKWNYSAELAKDVVDPMISVINNTIIVIDGRQDYNSVTYNGGIEFQYLRINNYSDYHEKDFMIKEVFKLGKIDVNPYDFLNIQFFVGTFTHDNNNDCNSNNNHNNNKSIYVISRYSLSNKLEFKFSENTSGSNSNSTNNTRSVLNGTQNQNQTEGVINSSGSTLKIDDKRDKLKFPLKVIDEISEKSEGLTVGIKTDYSNEKLKILKHESNIITNNYQFTQNKLLNDSEFTYKFSEFQVNFSDNSNEDISISYVMTKPLEIGLNKKTLQITTYTSEDQYKSFKCIHNSNSTFKFNDFNYFYCYNEKNKNIELKKFNTLINFLS